MLPSSIRLKLTGLLIACCVISAHLHLCGQSFESLQVHDSPLILKKQGSFYVGGKTVQQSFEELGSFGPGSSLAVNQMYVRYMVPASEEDNVPVVMIHGMALTGKSWETTPDGRMGWDEYFVRKGHATYVVDQVARGRSGFNQAILNNVRVKKVDADKLPSARRFADEFVWPNFRIGPKVGETFEVTLFPVDYLDELSKQGVPDLSGFLPDYGLNYRALSDLSQKLGKAVLISHSQSGTFPMEAALVNPDGIAAIVSIEPGRGRVRASLNSEQLEIFTKIPILFVFGDYLETPIEGGIFQGSAFWQRALNESREFAKQVNENGGNVEVLHLPEKGIKGNSHMIMQDTNNQDIADLIMEWILSNVD